MKNNGHGRLCIPTYALQIFTIILSIFISSTLAHSAEQSFITAPISGIVTLGDSDNSTTTCGNNIKENLESCDLGSFNGVSASGCLSDCSYEPLHQVIEGEFGLGMNLSAVNYWSSGWPFADAMKYAGIHGDNGRQKWKYTNSGAEPAMDTNGWPVVESGKTVFTYTMFDQKPNRFPQGKYVLTWEGSGIVNIDGGTAKNIVKNPNRIEFSASRNDGQGFIIKVTGPNDPRSGGVKNIKLWMPGTENQSSPFHPKFVEKLHKVKVLRFMDFSLTNGSNTERWSQRTLKSYFTQSRGSDGDGVAIEYMIELANEIDKDPWFTFPHRADDNYIREFARLVKQNLNPDKKIYLEYSNELWNGLFSQTKWLYETACNDSRYFVAHGGGNDWGITGCADNLAGARLQAKRSIDIFRIFEEEFGGRNRLVRVIASQSASPWITGKVLSAFDDSSLNPNNIEFDAVAIAPYFSPSNSDTANFTSSSSSTDVFDKLFKDINDVQGDVEDHAAHVINWSNKFNREVSLIAYEGGQHMIPGRGKPYTNIYYDVQSDPRMYDAYRQFFEIWNDNNGKLFTAFNYVEDWSEHGVWGHLEYQDQPTGTNTPRWNVLMDAADGKFSSSTGNSAVCGNRILESGEQCDLGSDNGSANVPCSSNCTIIQNEASPICGNGIIENLEICDNNSQLCHTSNSYPSAQACSTDCTQYEICQSNLFCGDGVCTSSPENETNCPLDCASDQPNNNIRIEAENIINTNYRSESWNGASNSNVVTLRHTGALQGAVKIKFDQSSGTYDIRVAYIDEDDGKSQFSLLINGQIIDNWIADTDNNQILIHSSSNITLSSNDEITILGQTNAGAYARIDYIELEPKVSTPVPTCGDGNLDNNERCDDNNNVDNDGCSATCTVEQTCGNNVIEGSETCDGAVQSCNKNGYAGTQSCDSTCSAFDGCLTDLFCGDNICSSSAENENSCAQDCAIVDKPNTGSITLEVWRNISGRTVNDLRNNSRYPDHPDEVTQLSSFQTAPHVMDNYGVRIRGYFHPTITGNYQFWIASDDLGELYLSSNESPNNKQLIAHVRSWTHPQQWDKYSEQKSIEIHLQAGKKYYIESLQKEDGGGDHIAIAMSTPLSSTITIIDGQHLSPYTNAPSVEICGNQEVEGSEQCDDGNQINGDGCSITCEIELPPPLQSENIIFEYWTNIGGSRISYLENNSNFPNLPNGTMELSSFETPSNWKDNFGGRVRAYLHPPVTGDYIFWIASDDKGELYLSPNESPYTKQQVAHVRGWTKSKQWDKYSGQKSVRIHLQAGKKYYIEAIYKEGGGGDNLAVAWQAPGQSRKVIDGDHLSPVIP